MGASWFGSETPTPPKSDDAVSANATLYCPDAPPLLIGSESVTDRKTNDLSRQGPETQTRTLFEELVHVCKQRESRPSFPIVVEQKLNGDSESRRPALAILFVGQETNFLIRAAAIMLRMRGYKTFREFKYPCGPGVSITELMIGVTQDAAHKTRVPLIITKGKNGAVTFSGADLNLITPPKSMPEAIDASILAGSNRLVRDRAGK